ncbi:MAG: hypothetical protein RR944_15085 [Acinetobacter sp.]|uniref:hypothetical protein n=1 Tax=Acinetobacter sp. TaxID=472 RepID=UPI002FC93F3E
MNKSILVFFIIGLIGCGGSSNSSSPTSQEFNEKMIKHCMRSAGVDVENPNDKVSMEQLAKIEKCLGN